MSNRAISAKPNIRALSSPDMYVTKTMTYGRIIIFYRKDEKQAAGLKKRVLMDSL